MSIVIALDIESTGLYPLGEPADAIIEVAGIKFDSESGEVLGTFESLVWTDVASTEGAFKAHGIGPATIAAAPRPEVVLPFFREFLGDHRLTAHNSAFDMGFLRAAFGRMGLPCLNQAIDCTLDMARHRYRGWPSYKLGIIADRLGYAGGNLHRAMADSARVKYLWMLMNRGPR